MHLVEKEQTLRLSLGEEKNMVTQLLVINLTIFVFLFFTNVIYNMEGMSSAQYVQDVLSRAALPADTSLLLHRPWTLITSLFTHDKFWDIFSNLLWLWCFGSFLQGTAGNQRILPLYLYSGIIGIGFYLLGMQFIPAFHAIQPYAVMTGASASVMALAIGATTVNPGYRIFPLLGGGIPLWIITAVFVAMHIGTHVSSLYDMTYLPALAGGGLTGFVYMQQWKKGRDLGAGLNRFLFKITHIFHPPEQQVDLTSVKKMLQADNRHLRREGAISEQLLNEILDKVHKEGMNALTTEEREILLRASLE